MRNRIQLMVRLGDTIPVSPGRRPVAARWGWFSFDVIRSKGPKAVDHHCMVIATGDLAVQTLQAVPQNSTVLIEGQLAYGPKLNPLLKHPLCVRIQDLIILKRHEP